MTDSPLVELTAFLPTIPERHPCPLKALDTKSGEVSLTCPPRGFAAPIFQ